MKKKITLCVLAALMLLTGCGRRTTAAAGSVHIKDYSGVPAYVQPLLDNSGQDAGSVIDPNAYVNVDIWVDGTPSMAGFVAGDMATTYRKALPRIEETAYNTWINADVNYYRFEIAMMPQEFDSISGMDTYLEENSQTLEQFTRDLYAFTPITAGASVRAWEQQAFYSKTTYFENYSAGSGDVATAATQKVKSIAGINWDKQALPPLRTALTMADTDNLSVIITDLYEEKGMVERIGNLMTERFFGQNKTVAVIGVMSEFAGPIYDIGESDQTIYYGVGASQNFVEYKSHPFYMILIGDEGEVNYFANAIKTQMDTEITDNVVYQSEMQLMKTGDWGSAADFSEITGFATDGVLTAQTQGDQKKMDGGQAADLRYTIPRAAASGRGVQETSQAQVGSVSFDFTVPVRIKSDKEVDFNTFAFSGDASVVRTVLKEVASGRRTGSEVQDSADGLPITVSVGSSKYAGDFAADEKAQALVEDITVLSVGEGTRSGDMLTCPVTFRVTMNAPSEIGIYRILLDTSVQCPSDLFPTDLEAWVDGWDISVADELSWVSDPAAFDGSKTLYLKRIMNQIVVSSNTLKTTGENALSPTHPMAQFYVDLYVDEQGYFISD